MFVWETMPRPRSLTVAALEIERYKLKKVLGLESRGQEYFTERQILKQSKRVRASAVQK